MKICNPFLVTVFLAFYTASTFAETGYNLEHKFVLEANGADFWMNKNNEMVFEKFDLENESNIIFYTRIELPGEILNITEIVGEQLLQLGYNPKSYSSKGKPWEGKYSLNYDIQSVKWTFPKIGIDDFGNVLLLFTDGDRFNNNIFSLGVWNKDHGFKVIETPGLDSVHAAIYNNDYLFVSGQEKEVSKVLIIPLKNGYWGEREQAKPSEKSWWDLHKPCCWPS